MKFEKVLAGVFAASLLTTAASAGEWADACIATLEAEGRDTSGCQCLEDAIDGNEDLIAEFLELGEISDPAERYASATSDAQAVMDQCTR